LSIETVRRNERRKLSATLFNTMAAGLLTVGVFAPTVALVLRIDSTRDNILALVATIATVVVLAGSLHFGGRYILGRLEE
jgi:hypothetical protein